jgi:hypothetical protein
MSKFTRVTFALLAILTLALTAVVRIGGSPEVALAQDEGEGTISCDSTLVLLLLLAEHNFDYISGMDETMMMDMPSLDLGQYTYYIEDTVARMTEMAGEMSEDDMTAMDDMNAMVEEMMGMDAAAILQGYDSAMGYEMMGDMTLLEPGNVPGEAAECTALRASLEQFIVSHLVAQTESTMMGEDDM